MQEHKQRKYYHSENLLEEISDSSFDNESEIDIDDLYLREVEQQQFENAEDTTTQDKLYFSIWNNFVYKAEAKKMSDPNNQFLIRKNKYLVILNLFLKECLEQLQSSKLRSNFIMHLLYLEQNNVICADNILELSLKFDQK